MELSYDPTSPEAALLDAAWRRVEASRLTAPMQPFVSPTSLSPAVDRVLTDALKVQVSRAEARADAQSTIVSEQRSRYSQLYADLEAERDVTAKLREEIVRLRTRQHDEEYKNSGWQRQLKEAQAEASTLRKERDHWQEMAQNALMARDTALRAAVALREMLRDAPGYTEDAAMALHRTQVLELSSQLRTQSPRPAAIGLDEEAPTLPSVGGQVAALLDSAGHVPMVSFSWERGRRQGFEDAKDSLSTRIEALEEELVALKSRPVTMMPPEQAPKPRLLGKESSYSRSNPRIPTGTSARTTTKSAKK